MKTDGAARHGLRVRPPSAKRKVDRPGGRHPSEADWMPRALRIKTAAFRHNKRGEVTGRESGARSKRDGWREPLGIRTSLLRQFGQAGHWRAQRSVKAPFILRWFESIPAHQIPPSLQEGHGRSSMAEHHVANVGTMGSISHRPLHFAQVAQRQSGALKARASVVRSHPCAPFRGHSSEGRAPVLQAGCRRFDSVWLHQIQQ